MNRNEFEGIIIAKAWKDPQFRKRLLADPKKVMQEELAAVHPGAKLPDDLKIKVVEETEKELTIVLPVDPTTVAGKGALSDEDLDAVAGGTISVVVSIMPGIVNMMPINVNVFPSVVNVGPVAAVVTGPAATTVTG